MASAPASTHCHRAGWREVMSDALGHECYYLVAQDEQGAWRGVLPIVRVRGLLGHFLVSMPFLNDGGPLGDDLAQTSAGRARRSRRSQRSEQRSSSSVPVNN